MRMIVLYMMMISLAILLWSGLLGFLLVQFIKRRRYLRRSAKDTMRHELRQEGETEIARSHERVRQFEDSLHKATQKLK